MPTKEITKLPSNAVININIQEKSFNFYLIDYKENNDILVNSANDNN